MASRIAFRQYDLLAPLFSTSTYTEHLARPHLATRDDDLVRLRIGHVGRALEHAPELGSRIHARILRLVDAGRHEDIDYVAYEHVAGVRLSDVAISGSMRKRPACAVAVVLDVLRAAHAYRGWLEEYAREFIGARRPITADDVWVGMDGSTYLSVVDLPNQLASVADHVPVSDVESIGRTLLSLLRGSADTPTRLAESPRSEGSVASLEAVASRALGRGSARYLSSEAMSVELYRVAMREGLIASVEAVSAAICASFPDRIAAQRPVLLHPASEQEDEPTIIRAFTQLERASVQTPARTREPRARGEARRRVETTTRALRSGAASSKALPLVLALLFGGVSVAILDRASRMGAPSVPARLDARAPVDVGGEPPARTVRVAPPVVPASPSEQTPTIVVAPIDATAPAAMRREARARPARRDTEVRSGARATRRAPRVRNPYL